MLPSDLTELAVDRGAFALRGWAAGAEDEGAPVLCLHETATSGEVWRPLAATLAAERRVAAYDRRGWGRSGAPEDYRRTTVEEQAADAETVIADVADAPVALCGAGLGAVIALDLAARRPELVHSAVLVEPPVLGLVPAATAALAADVEAIRRVVAAAAARLTDDADPRQAAEAGAAAALDLYRGGGLSALGAGAERIPADLAAGARANSFALFAEVAATTGWSLPLAALANVAVPVAVAVGESTPAFVRRAAEALAPRLPRADLRRLPATGLPQLDSSAELAAIVLELA